jgi:hypothetical protein
MKKHETDYVEMTIEGFIPKGCEKAVKEDGKFYFRLVKDFNVLCDVEQETGLNLLRPESTDSRVTRAMLYAYLKEYNPELTIFEAGNLLTMDQDACFEAMSRVMNMGQPAQQEQAAGQADAAQV